MSLGQADVASELWRRVAVTAVALAAYALAWNIPLPGVNLAMLSPELGPGSEDAKRLSIAALGVSPLFTALMLAELLKVLIPSLRRWDEEPWRETQTGLVLAVALLLAGVQGAGYARALEDVASIVAEPGMSFRIGTTVTLVAATAFIAWLADQITRYGVGSGFWLLLGAPAIGDVLPGLARTMVLLQTGEMPGTSLILYAGFVAASIAGIVALEWGRFREGALTTSATLWPMVLAFFVLFTGLQYLLAIGGRDMFEVYTRYFAPGQPLFLVLLVVIVAGSALLYARSLAGTAGAPQPGRDAPPVVVAGGLAAIALAGELVRTHLQVPLAFDGRSIVIVTVLALSILSASRRFAPSS